MELLTMPREGAFGRLALVLLTIRSHVTANATSHGYDIFRSKQGEVARETASIGNMVSEQTCSFLCQPIMFASVEMEAQRGEATVLSYPARNDEARKEHTSSNT